MSLPRPSARQRLYSHPSVPLFFFSPLLIGTSVPTSSLWSAAAVTVSGQIAKALSEEKVPRCTESSLFAPVLTFPG